MKQILQNPRTGALELAEVPAPAVGHGQLRVRNAFSVVSPGTEKLALEFARKSLLGKARSRPDLVRQVTRKLRQEGPLATYRAVTSRLETPQPLGYSSAGIVETVGDDVSAFRPGDRVACAGAGYACHAEIIVVPENLVATVPNGLPLEQAAFATIGAIALQGLRVAAPTLGEVAAVIGLGPIGQLTVQLLRANGCRVLAIDLDGQRVSQALDQGAEWGAAPGDDLEPWKMRVTTGYGVDLAIVTASSENASPLRLAADLCRLKGRVALVGALPIEIDRRPLYEKELEIRMSTSYGPGRYDRSYEEEGFDYPLPWVRWTEKRNIEAFLALAARGDVRPDRLEVETVPFDDAVRLYDELARGERRALAALFRYPDAPSSERALEFERPTVAPPLPARIRRDRVGVAFLGAGSYARSVLLPLLARRKDARALAVVTATGASARATAQRFGFERYGTDPEVALSDPNVDLVFVATRHNTHADLAERALRAGKAVWLEKPIGLTIQEVDCVIRSAEKAHGPLLVGYNRRFSPHAERIRRAFADRRGPMIIHYRVAAGPTPRNSWITDPKVGGGRIISESCHFVDLCTFLVGQVPEQVQTHNLGADPAVDDSIVAILTYPDRSIATIEYLAHADPALPKEQIFVSSDHATARCDNFRETVLPSGRRIRTRSQDKGQRSELALAFELVRTQGSYQWPLSELHQTSQITFRMARKGIGAPHLDTHGKS